MSAHDATTLNVPAGATLIATLHAKPAATQLYALCVALPSLNEVQSAAVSCTLRTHAPTMAVDSLSEVVWGLRTKRVYNAHEIHR
jgi:hypothetical protein